MNFDSSLYLKVQVTQLCPTLCDPMDYTVHGILQARILEWVAFPFSRGLSQFRDQTQVSHIAERLFTSWTTREALPYLSISIHYFLLQGSIPFVSIHLLMNIWTVFHLGLLKNKISIIICVQILVLTHAFFSLELMSDRRMAESCDRFMFILRNCQAVFPWLHYFISPFSV